MYSAPLSSAECTSSNAGSGAGPRRRCTFLRCPPCWRSIGIFRAYDGLEFPDIVSLVRPTRRNYRGRAESPGTTTIDTNTLLIILVVIFLFGGFGYYGRGRWF
jgi:hypothetical protein